MVSLEPADGTTEKELLLFAYSLEKKSEHPVAKAIVKKAQEAGLSSEAKDVSDFTVLPGVGVQAVREGRKLFAGQQDGKIVFTEDGRVLGFITVSDAVKDDSRSAISALRQLGIRVYMITGDNKKTAQKIADEVGTDGFYAETLPAFKANYPDEYESVLGGLMKLGVNHIINISFGADITTWGYLNYVQKYNFNGGISQPCPAIVGYIEHYLPELLPKLFRVTVPAQCADPSAHQPRYT